MTRLLHPLLVVLAIILGAVGISRLSFEVSLIKLLPADLPGVTGTAALQQFHDRPDELLLTLKSADGSDTADLAAGLAENLAATPGLVRAVQSEPAWVAAPDGLTELAAHSWLNAPPAQVRALAQTLAPDRIAPFLTSRVEAVSGTLNPMTAALESRDPLGFGTILASAADAGGAGGTRDGFSTADGSFHLLQITLPSGTRGYRAISLWLHRLRAAVAAWQSATPGAAALTVSYTGSPAFEAEIGTGMERDMNQSVSGITLLVGLLFWLLHRRIRPLVLLLVALLLTGLITLGVAGLAFGSLDVMSMGFAAILMGMVEDFGVMGLHESMRRPAAGFRAVHRAVFPSVAWSAVATAAVFGMLGLSALPGIARMGILTALGILIGAAVMLYFFLPLAMRWRGGVPEMVRPETAARPARWPGWAALVLLVGCTAALLWRGLPAGSQDTGILRPKHCAAFDALTDLQRHLQPADGDARLFPVIVQSATPAATLHQLEEKLAAATAEGRVVRHFLPTAWIPDPARQAENLPVLARLAADRDRLTAAMDAAGFTAEGMAFSHRILEHWQAWAREPAATRWPAAELLEKYCGPVLRREGEAATVCGMVALPAAADPATAPVLTEIQQLPGVHVGGLDYLTGHLRALVRGEVRRVLLPALGVLVLLLGLVFRGVRERVVALVSLAFSALVLLGWMSALGLGWNFVNIGAVPLVLGLGLDFNIHIIHALRERGADGHGIGRALAYCGLSTGLAFGALSFSDNAGLSSFGHTAMIGVLATLFSAAFLVPWLWRRLR